MASNPTLHLPDLGTKTSLQEQWLGSRIQVQGSICDWTQTIQFTVELRGYKNLEAETHNNGHEKHILSIVFQCGEKVLMARCVCPSRGNSGD